jgi:DNA (cytosine-5)-methyltransferase 1
MDTVTSRTRRCALAVDNYQGAARGVEPMPLPTQGGLGDAGVLSSGVVPFRKNTIPTSHGEAMPTVTSDQIPGLLTAAGTIKNNGSIDEAEVPRTPGQRPARHRRRLRHHAGDAVLRLVQAERQTGTRPRRTR